MNASTLARMNTLGKEHKVYSNEVNIYNVQ